MTQPPKFAPRPLPKPGLFRRTPPALFPPLLGTLALGLGWREGAGLFGLPGGLAEAFLGAAVLLWAFMHLAYLAKLARRPGVLAEDLAILPGRAGLGAAVMSDYSAAMAIAPYAPDLARALLVLGLALHLLLMLAVIRALRAGPEAGRDVTPAWHLVFVGPILGAVAALVLGWDGLARVIFVLTLPMALFIWGTSLRQLVRRIPPAPLRPLLAIHLAPASLFGLVAIGLGWTEIAFIFAALASVILLALLVSGRWVLESGFSPLWGALTFPLAAFARLMLSLPGWATLGGVALVLATLVILPILVRVLQDWARGRLAIKTNAAEA
jgi:tellurite resistance protein